MTANFGHEEEQQTRHPVTVEIAGPTPVVPATFDLHWYIYTYEESQSRNHTCMSEELPGLLYDVQEHYRQSTTIERRSEAG